ncbi:hypothetical protein Patl1_36680 [Pistacia atlantica]|nr:hypothetical protein Patl1_36680 [Pistacia atlantica]
MQGGEELSIEELFSNLSTYKEQLQQVRQLLVDDPGNSEYADMEKELTEVISFVILSIWGSLSMSFLCSLCRSVYHLSSSYFEGSTCCSNKQQELTAMDPVEVVLCVVMASLLPSHLISDVTLRF